jgi:zinc protease
MRGSSRLAVCVLVLLAGVGLESFAAEPARRAAVHRWSVDDHTTGILVQDARAPVVEVWLEFPVGRWSAWARDVDLQSAMAIQLYDPEGALRRRADLLAADLSSFAAERYSVIRVVCLKQDLAGVGSLLQDVIANRRFDRGELKRWKRQAKIEWKGRRTDVRFLGGQLAARALFHPDDPRRLPYEGPRNVTTDPGSLLPVRDRVVRLPGRVVGLAGDLTPQEAESFARELLPPASVDPTVDVSVALLPLRDPDERDDAETRVPRLTQVYFALLRESVPYSDPDYPAFALANHVLGGHFYSRIMVALRHEGGETYGAFAFARPDVAPAPFLVGSFTRTDNAAHAETELRQVLETFHATGITEEEREETVGYLAGRAPFDRQTPGQILALRLRERRLGLEAGFFDALPDRAAALSLEQINAFIAAYYDPTSFVMARVAPTDEEPR